PLPPGKINNGPVKPPAARPDQPKVPPGSEQGKAIARFKKEFAASLAAPHRAPGPAKPPQIAAAESKLAAMKKNGLLGDSPAVLGQWERGTRVRNEPVRFVPFPAKIVNSPPGQASKAAPNTPVSAQSASSVSSAAVPMSLTYKAQYTFGSL